jgi:diguanylate cyclase (GGDEF)-like protein
MWSISSLGELTRYDPATLQPEKVPLPGIGGGRMARLVAGPDRTLWLSSYEHLFAIRLVEGEMTFERMQLPPEAIDCTKVVSPAPDGVIWTGGPAGLCRYDGTWRRFTTRDGLRLDQVDFMAAVSGEEVWFVYQDLVGVAHVKLVDGEPEIRHFGTAQGLPSNTVYSLGLDARGRLWAGGNAGLVLFSRDGPSRVYDMNDGLIWDDLSSHSFLAEPDGSFFIGTSRGLARFDPSGRAPVERPPRIVVTSALTGDVERLGEDSPVVPYAERTFQVAYSALTFRDPQAVRFRYRLLPLEDEYLETAMREVRYPGLQARDYMFEVVAISASGLWSVEPATFSFTIRPPWWGTWWARVIAIALVMLLIASIVWLRTRRLDLARRRLEAAVAERSAELARANKELEEMSHTDVLTDTRNRRYFMSVIDDNVARVLRRHDRRSTTESGINRGIVFYIIDIDWFKKVNDEHGHRTGDRVLADVARRISSVLRQSDLLVRWGGEEFLVVCSDSEPSQGSQVSKRILDAVGTAPFDLGDGSVLRRTCSIGWAGFPWIAGDPGAVSYETVIELADKGLYLAKASGRNMAIGVMPLSGSPPSSWLDAPLAALEGSKVELVRTPGPDQPPG